ncbi:MAG: hypothetical protein AAFY71_25960 [Bacteroidota bacterium]
MRRLQSLIWLFSALVVFSLSSCKTGLKSYAFPQVYLDQQVNAYLTPLEEKYDDKGPILMQFTIQNIGTEPVKLCRWNSPLEGNFSEDYLKVLRKEKYVLYTGSRIKRKQKLIKSFVTLYPGESLSQVFDLAEGYEIKKKGTYSIAFEGDAMNHLPSTEAVEITVK